MKKIKLCATFLLSLCCLMGAVACGNNNSVTPQNLPGQERTVTDNMTDESPDGECPNEKDCPNDECPNEKDCPDGKHPNKHHRQRHPSKDCPNGDCSEPTTEEDVPNKKSGSDYKTVIPENMKPAPELPLDRDKLPNNRVIPIPRPEPIPVPRREF